jgi:hypothetical protein
MRTRHSLALREVVDNRLEQRRGNGDLYRLAGVADGQYKVDAGSLTGAQENIFPLGRFEAGRPDADVLGGRLQRRANEVAGGTGGQGVYQAGLALRDGYGGIHNNAAGMVGNVTDESRKIALRKQRRSATLMRPPLSFRSEAGACVRTGCGPSTVRCAGRAQL